MYLDFQDYVGAIGDRAFLGRKGELDFMGRLVGREGTEARLIVLEGAAGIGKSELLRRFAVDRATASSATLPLYFDLAPYGLVEPRRAPTQEAELWADLIEGLARQIVAFEQRLPLLAPPLCGSGAEGLAQLAYAAGLGEWIPALRRLPLPPRAAEQTWRGILRSRAGGGGPRPVLVFDGLSLSRPDKAVVSVIRAAAAAANAEQLAVVVEGGRAPVPALAETAAIESLVVGGLASEECLTLIERLSPGDNGMPASGGVERVLSRLGGNPSSLRHWSASWERFPTVQNKVRRAETAYLQLISRSPAADRWRACIDAVVPAAARPTMIRTLAAFARADSPSGDAAFGAEEFQLRTALTRDAAEAALAELGHFGLVRRSGESWAVHADQVFRDWLAYQAACIEPGAEASGRPQAEFMRQLLTRAAPESATSARPAELLRRFALQRIPQALFSYDQYYEALGEVPPEKREHEIMQTKVTLRLPEVVGAVLDRPAPGAPVRPFALHYAHGYRDGIYRRSNEETWVVGDFTHLPTLTSLEVEQFRAAAADLERRLGPGRYTRWMLAGDAVSPEALELLGRERTLCSAAEQLRILRRAVEEPESHASRAPLPTRAGLAPAMQLPPPAPRHVPVIPITEVSDEELGRSTSRLSLIAEQQNEVIAASMAEKIAQRCGFDAESIGQIKMAVLEGCLNAIEHSLNPEKEVRLTFYQRPGELEIAIENEGEVFDPLAVADPDPAAKLKDKNKRGWGIKLMRQFMDDVRYEPARGGMCLRLIKKKKLKEAESKPSGARKM